MKSWPKDKTEVVSYEDLVAEIKRLFLKVCPKKSWKKFKSLDYQGYDVDALSIRAGCSGPRDQLSAQMVEYHRERGRDLVDILIMITFHLGYCQGERNEKKNSVQLEKITEMYERMLDRYQAEEKERQKKSGEKPVSVKEKIDSLLKS